MASSGKKSEATALTWFRRDLRLSDHPALSAALSEFDRVVPLFVWDPALLGPTGPARLAFLAGCVSALDDSLDGRLVTRQGMERTDPAIGDNVRDSVDPEGVHLFDGQSGLRLEAR